MKKGYAWILFAFAICAARAGTEVSAQSGAPMTTKPVAISSERTETILLAPQMVTSIGLPSGVKVDEVRKGSNLVQVEFNPTHNTLDIFPTVTEGATNLTVRVGSRVYTFLLKISTEENPSLARTYTFEDAGDEFDSTATQAPHLRPSEINTIQAIKTIEKARFDPAYRDTLSNFRTIPIGKTMLWNFSPVTLVEVNQFSDQDLLVLKVEWSNAAQQVLNLESGQVRLRVANTEIPVSASQQESSRLFPGQMDTIWLFVQGYRVSPRNDWRLFLPPDSDAIRRLQFRR